MNKSELFYPGSKFVKDLRNKSNNWDSENNPAFVLYRGIVIDVYYDTTKKNDSFNKPPFSLNVKIIGQDVSTINPKSDSKNWYAPLFPLNFIILPEVGEEVLVIKENTSMGSIGYWIGRVNESPYITRYLSREWLLGKDPMFKYGYIFDVYDLASKETNLTPRLRHINTRNLKPGDIILQDRVGSYIHQTRDNSNNQSKIILATDTLVSSIVNIPTGPKEDFISENKTEIKLISKGNIFNEVGISTKSSNNLDDSSLIVNKAGKIINRTTYQGSESILYSQVLGEKLNDALTNIINNLNNALNNMAAFIYYFHEHKHASDQIEKRLYIPYYTDTGLSFRVFTYYTPALITQQPNNRSNVGSQIDNIRSSANNLLGIKNGMNNILSKNNLLN